MTSQNVQKRGVASKEAILNYDVTMSVKWLRHLKRRHLKCMTSQNVQKRGVASKEAILNYDVTMSVKRLRHLKQRHFICMTSLNAQTKRRGFKRSHFEFMTSQ
jgi:hypothetical protein